MSIFNIITSRGVVAVVDAEDAPKVQKAKWNIQKNGYVRGQISRAHIFLHRLIMNAPEGLEVDHINGDKLDNRKANLRLCTHSENMRNKRQVKAGKTLPKGVTLQRNRRSPYRAQIGVNGNRISLGSYLTVQEAVDAYNKAALYHFGDFAGLSKIS